MIKLCVFDFDSTLMDGETITYFGKVVGKSDEIGAITKRAMAGELDFFESLKARVAFLKGAKLADIEQIARNLPYITGAKEIIEYLKSKGILVGVFSGGYHIATDHAQELLGFDINFANILHHKDGVLTGEVGGEMMFGFSKGQMLWRLRTLLGLSKDEVAVVGDGANDISMFKEAGVCVAFCANEILKNSATHIIEKKDLRELKNIL